MMVVASFLLEARINIGELDEIGESLTCTKALYQAYTKKWQEDCRSEILQFIEHLWYSRIPRESTCGAKKLEKGEARE